MHYVTPQSKNTVDWFQGENCNFTGSASTVKEPGHFEVRKSSSQVTRSQGRSQDFLRGALFSLVIALKTQAPNTADCFTVKIKQIKQSDMVTFLLSVHTITEAKQ